MATDFVQKNGKLPIFVALAFRIVTCYRLVDERINSSTNWSTSCKKMVKIG